MGPFQFLLISNSLLIRNFLISICFVTHKQIVSVMNLVKFTVTGFGVGLSPYAPGTLGSLMAFPISYGILFASSRLGVKLNIASLHPSLQELLGMACVFIVAFAIILIGGIYLSDIYIRQTGKEDPPEVVIDEIMGQMLTIILSCMTDIFAHKSYLVNYLSPDTIDLIFIFLLPFIFFRLFDILKPWPIGYIDKTIKGGFGVMLDDFLAAIFASIMCYAFTFILILR
ncbi:MAG: phosphatidylglycerophosphatase A [Alphaproteobacteria bacterium]|nr:phosphatidylglycerophosphatase A [Alphaproteobacteria bacterium]